MKAYTIKEAASALRVHPDTIRRAIKAGKLKAAKVGRDYRILHEDLQKYFTDLGGGELGCIELADPNPVTVTLVDCKSDKAPKALPRIGEELREALKALRICHDKNPDALESVTVFLSDGTRLTLDDKIIRTTENGRIYQRYPWDPKAVD